MKLDRPQNHGRSRAIADHSVDRRELKQKPLFIRRHDRYIADHSVDRRELKQKPLFIRRHDRYIADHSVDRRELKQGVCEQRRENGKSPIIQLIGVN